MKLGVYGGSFNPPHLGHLRAAVAAAKELELDELLLIPAGIPPHKELSEGAPDASHRAAMTELVAERAALAADIPVKVSRMEIERGGKSYTVDTLRALRERHPRAELWLLMGTDMFRIFQNWYRPEEILSYAGVCAFGREKAGAERELEQLREALAEQFSKAKLRTMLIPDVVEISSSELRALLPKGEGDRFLPPQVYGYILREHLYGTDLDLRRLTPDELRPVALSYLKAKRVPHVLGVEQEAKRLAERYGADV